MTLTIGRTGRAVRSLLAAVLLVLPAVAWSTADSPATAHAANGFTGLAPARLWDTRSGPGIETADGTNVGTGRLGAGQTYRLKVAGRGGVPATGASAIVANVTAIEPSEPSFLTIFPAGASRPNASNLNTDAGRTLPNAVIVPLSTGGEIDVFNAAGSTDVALDVLGWFDGSGGFTGLTPARLWETRSARGLTTTDGRSLGTGPLGPDATFRLKVTGRGGVPSTGVGAVALNVTAIAPSEPGFVTLFPAGANRPNASNLNTAPGRTLPNMVVVPVSAAGEIDVYNAFGSTDMAIDVLGWFRGGADALQPLTPSRIWDTRSGPGIGTVDGRQQGTGRLGSDVAFGVQVTGRAGVPRSGVGAVALNVTAIAPDAGSFITVYAAGRTRPSASNLNTAPGRTLPNLVIVPVSSDGTVDVYNFAGTTDLAVDVLGWFPGVPAGDGGGGGTPTPGWTLTSANTGLAGVGLTCAGLPLYTGPMKPAANTTISRVRITWEEFDLSNGNITLDEVCIQPTTAGGRMSIVFGYNPETGSDQLGPVTIQDSDIDGSLITDASVYASCAFRGAANLYRNRMFGMGSGICYFGSPSMTSSVIEGNYVYGLRSGFYGSPPQQSHNESATVRSFSGTSLQWRNNRLESLSGADSGAMFIQTAGHIQNVTMEGNLFHTTAWNLVLEAKNGFSYSNMQAIDNRFVVPPGGFGAAYVDGGPGWAVWSENHRYDAAAPGGKGTPVAPP